MTPETFREMLIKRGCGLNDPASDKEIAEMQRLIGATPNWPTFLKLYSCFNGFANIDQISMINVWPIGQILSFSPIYVKNPEMIAFSDVQFDAEIMHMSKGNDRAIYGISEAIIASSLDEFLEQIIEDRVQFA